MKINGSRREPADMCADIVLPRQCYGALVLSPHAHAIIRKIDITKAKAAPGVLCVLTGADCHADKIGGIPPFFMPEHWGGPKGYGTTRPVLVSDRVRCVGDRVAFVVAETEDQAKDAAELVEIEYETLPSLVDVEKASSEQAFKIWQDCPNGNVAASIGFGDKAATDAAFASAAHKVSVRLVNNRITANPIEPRCAIGVFDAATGKYTLHTTSQDPHGVRSVLASNVLRVPETKVHVISPDVGGGFGIKANIYPDDVLVLLASNRCGRPVKWTATRSESLVLGHPRAGTNYLRRARARCGGKIPRHQGHRLSSSRCLLVGSDHSTTVFLADARFPVSMMCKRSI